VKAILQQIVNMKQAVLLPLMLLLAAGFVRAQDSNPGKTDSLNEILGTYQFEGNKNIVRKQDNTLLLDFLGQGKTSLTPLTKNRFRVDHVNPEAIIEFVKDSAGVVHHFRWIQDIGTLKWIRKDDKASSGDLNEQGTEGMYAGRYLERKKNKELIVKEEEGMVTAHVTGEGTLLTLLPNTENQLVYKSGDLQLFLNFQKITAGSSLLLFLIDRSITSLSLTHIHFLLPMQDKRLMNVTCKNRNGHYLFVYYKILLSLLPQFAFCLQLL